MLSITGSDITRHPVPCEQNESQTGVKTLPCPKLRLRAVKSDNKNVLAAKMSSGTCNNPWGCLELELENLFYSYVFLST